MGQDLAEKKPIINSDSAKEPTGKAATATVEIQSNKSSQEPTVTTQQSPRPSYLAAPSDNDNTRATTHPQTQIWQNSTITSQPSPKPYQFNNSNKQTMQEQEQNRVVPQEPAAGAGATGAMKDKGQNKRQQRVNKEDSSRDECSNNNNNNNNGTTASPTTTFAAEKPSVGSEEWHRLRRENHKQVERRRRETINEGINEIAKMIPGNEKNKGQILHRAAVHIRTLKEQQAEALEKWTLEKLLTDQAMNELSRQVDALKAEVDQTRKENEELKRRLVLVKEDPSTSERATKRLKSQE